MGLVAAAFLSRLMASLLHGVTPADPATFFTVAVSLTLVALLASLVPAWRAASLDPVRALKSE
jgi:ABC-type lipoprotein release transport system permease subunit